MGEFIKPTTVKEGFRNAYAGFHWAFKNQLNLKIHLTSVTLVLIASVLFRISYAEWLVVLTAIFGVLTLELVNTSIEQTTDAITREYNPIIKRAKDISAAAVLMYAVFALIIGILIFVPKINIF